MTGVIGDSPTLPRTPSVPKYLLAMGLALPVERREHGERIPRRGDVVDADDSSAALDREQSRSEAACEPVVGPADLCNNNSSRPGGLLAGMTANPALAAPNLHYVLASRHLERIADHATNIAEDILFWVRGLEVRHGRAKQIELNPGGPASSEAE